MAKLLNFALKVSPLKDIWFNSSLSYKNLDQMANESCSASGNVTESYKYFFRIFTSHLRDFQNNYYLAQSIFILQFCSLSILMYLGRCFCHICWIHTFLHIFLYFETYKTLLLVLNIFVFYLLKFPRDCLISCHMIYTYNFEVCVFFGWIAKKYKKNTIHFFFGILKNKFII